MLLVLEGNGQPLPYHPMEGSAVVVAVQTDPDTGCIDTYWLAHGTVLLRASRQHVRRLVSDDGLVNGSQRAEQALAGLRQRRVVRTVDLRRINQHTLEELEPEISSPEDQPDLQDQQIHEPDQLHQRPVHVPQQPASLTTAARSTTTPTTFSSTTRIWFRAT